MSLVNFVDEANMTAIFTDQTINNLPDLT